MLDENTQPLKYCLYARKSSESDERQAMSIDSQIKEMEALAQREGLFIKEVKRESHSAKQSAGRPLFNELLNDIRDGKFDAILTWAPNRLSRNAGDLGSLVDLMDSNTLTTIRTHSQSFSNNPNEKFLLMILCSQAKLENDNRAINVKRGIRAKCEMGWRPCMPPIGYYTRASTGGVRDTIIDEERAPYVQQMFEMCAAGKSGRHIKQWLIDSDVKTRKGNTISLSMVYKMLKSTFYYGEFEYPIGSGNWYEGKHPALISKTLFERVQKQLVVPQKSKWGAKEFPYKGLLKCGSCGSSVVGEEKRKKLKNGSYNYHVYYHCSRQVDYSCSEKFTTENDVAEQLLALAPKLRLNSKQCEPGLIKAIEHYAQITQDVDSEIGYIRYVINRGTAFEKTRLARNIYTPLTLHNREITVLVI